MQGKPRQHDKIGPSMLADFEDPKGRKEWCRVYRA